MGFKEEVSDSYHGLEEREIRIRNNQFIGIDRVKQ
jgi:hypothetical protein